MTSRAIVVPFHLYTPFGKSFYDPIYKYFMQQMQEYKNEYTKLYLIDSNWGLEAEYDNVEVIKVNPSLRYYDAYKEALPKIKEDLVLLLDNDMVVYRKGRIDAIFEPIERGSRNVVSIYDTIGKTYKELGDKSKFCPYLFATSKELLMKYRDCEWGPNMPEHETLGKLTEMMLKDGLKPYEMVEDKSNFLFDGTKDAEKGKDLGYYHIRSGSLPAYLLATINGGDPKTYYDYLKNQPKSEYLRQIAWYWYMCYSIKDEDNMLALTRILQDAGVSEGDWYEYFFKFVKYHNLPFKIITYASQKAIRAD